MKRLLLASMITFLSVGATIAVAQACPAGTYQCVVCTGTDGAGHCVQTKIMCCFPQ